MPLLALHDVRKSYGAVKVTDGISLAVTAGETLGILGPNGARQDDLVQPDLRRRPRRRRPGRVRGSRRHHAAAAPALPRRHRPQLPGAAALRRHDRVREPGHRGLLRRRPAGAPGLGERRARPRVHGPASRMPTRPRAASRCSIASGWSWRARWPRGRSCCCSTRSPAA